MSQPYLLQQRRVKHVQAEGFSWFRLEKAAAKLPKKDLAAVKKRFAFLEVLAIILHMVLMYISMHHVCKILIRLQAMSLIHTHLAVNASGTCTSNARVHSAGGCAKHRGRCHSNAKVCQQPSSLLCCAAGASSNAHATTHPYRN